MKFTKGILCLKIISKNNWLKNTAFAKSSHWRCSLWELLRKTSKESRTCAYQGVGNDSFSEHFAYVLNEWSLRFRKVILQKSPSVKGVSLKDARVGDMVSIDNTDTAAM